MKWCARPWSLVCSVSMFALPAWGDEQQSSTLTLMQRRRVETAEGSGRFHAITQAVRWDARQTAIIVCDMWDLHHCLNATHRVKEMAPRMNQILGAARARGVLIIHAPSSCMDTYRDHPARQRAIQTPRAQNLPPDIGQWCRHIPAEDKGKYPIDQSDGGEDDDPSEHAAWAEKLKGMGRNPRAPWKSQIDLVEIESEDVISDNGAEIWSVLAHRGIQNVILVGVHTNMCVLGRPFGLRQMAKNGKNVVLMRDLTDTMYNPARSPYVNHFTGTDLIVEHIEKWVCPTITSDQIASGQPFRFNGDRRPHVVIVMGEQEYETNRTLPRFALEHLGKAFRVSLVHASEPDPHELPGLEVLRGADVLLLSVRRRAIPKEQMDLVRQFVASGRAVVGIRTANHAFSLRGKVPAEGMAVWEELDQELFGGNYTGHHGAGPPLAVRLANAANPDHPILAGVDLAALAGRGSLYKTSPLAPSATPLLLGAIPGAPAEPVAWIHTSKSGGPVFYTSLGHPGDFEQPAFNRLLANALHWAADLRSAPNPAPDCSTRVIRPSGS